MSPLFFIKGCDVLKKIKRSVMCIFLSGMLVFNGGYKSYVNAFSLAVIGTITLGEAILYCAATLGTVYVASEVYENADTLAFAGEQMLTDFKEWCADCTEYIDVTTREVEDWLGKVAEGTLDKGCEVWQAFKDYIVHLNDVQIENSSSFNQGTQEVTLTFNQVKQAFNLMDKTTLYNSKTTVPTYNLFDFVDYSEYGIASDGISVAVSIKFTDQSDLVICSNAYAKNPVLIGSYGVGGDSFYYASDGSKYVRVENVAYNTKTIDGCPSFGGSYCSSSGKGFSNVNYLINLNCASWQLDGLLSNQGNLPSVILASGVINGYWDFSIPVPDWGIADDVVIDKNVQDVIERDGTLDNVDVWGYGDMTLDKDDVLTIPWENVQPTDLSEPFVGGQTVAIDLVDGVTVDTDIPVEDIPVEPVVPRDSYTIPNLETVFPFCVPFDLVKIFTLFNAEPEAPHFTWKFYFWVGEMKTYDVEIDLSPFDSVAEILRLMELIGFMVFLTLKTRDLIRG